MSICISAGNVENVIDKLEASLVVVDDDIDNSTFHWELSMTTSTTRALIGSVDVVIDKIPSSDRLANRVECSADSARMTRKFVKRSIFSSPDQILIVF